MKKNLLFFVAVVSMLAWASCSQDTTEMADKGGVIKFRPSVNGITRVSPTYISNLYSFNVTGFFDEHSTNYFTNWQVNKNGNTWTPVNERFWPNTDARLSVYAYAPTTGIGTVSISKNGQTVKGFTVAERDINQIDFLAAAQFGKRTDFESSGIPLRFNHALTMIDVYARNVNTENYYIKVIGLKLVGFKSKADFTFPNAAYTTLPFELWKNATSEKSFYSDLGTSPRLLTADYQSLMSSYFMMIPQQLTPWNKTASKSGAYIALLMQIYSREYGSKAGNLVQIFPKKQDKYAYVAVPIDTKLLPGKKYVFRLTFMENGAGNIAPDPTNPYNPDIIDPDPGPGGKEIFGGPIKVTITVDDWSGNNYTDKDL